MHFFLKFLLDYSLNTNTFYSMTNTIHYTVNIYSQHKLLFPVDQSYVHVIVKLDELMHELLWITLFFSY